MITKGFFFALFRSKIALTLNVVGLSLAFATCMIILMHVQYETTFDKGYTTSGRIFQLDQRTGLGGKFETYIARPLAELAFASTPLIKSGAVREQSTYPFHAYLSEKGASSAISVQSIKASAQLPLVFGLNAIFGSFDDFHISNKAIIPQTIAAKLFGTENPVGKTLVLDDSVDMFYLEIIAVFKDVPVNSSLPNAIITSLADEDISDWGNVAYSGYMLIDFPEDAKKAEIDIQRVVNEGYSLQETYIEEIPLIRLQGIHERYFDRNNPDHVKGNIKGLISLITVAIIVIIIAVVNFINFSLSSVPKRITTINIKKILGSTRLELQLIQYLEAITITTFSAAFAVLLIYILSHSSFAKIFDANMALEANVQLILIVFVIAVLTGLAAIIIPANYTTTIQPVTVIQGTFSLTKKGKFFRTIMVTFQYFASIILIIVALSVHTQYNYMLRYDIGFAKSAIFTTHLSTEMLQQQKAISDKLKQYPEILDVAFSYVSFVDCSWRWLLGYGSENIRTYFFPVSSNFTSMMNIFILEGRDFTIEDESGNGKYIFNETAQKMFGIKVGDLIENDRRNRRVPIVGISKDFNFMPLHYRIEPFALYVVDTASVWWNLAQTYIKVQEHDIEGTKNYIRTTLLEYDPDAASTLSIESMDKSIGNLYQKERNLSIMITVFSLLALIISAIGALGMIYFEIQFRRKEVGIRKILGASVTDILMIFNRKYIKIIFISFVIAMPVAYVVVQQWQQNFMYKAPLPIFSFFYTGAILLVITMVMISLQSLFIARQNPTKSISK